MDSKRRILILGNGIFAEEVADLISDVPGFTLAGFVENLDRARCATKVLNKPVHWVDELECLSKDHHLISGIGTTKRCLYVEQAAKYGLPFATLRHPSSRLSVTSTLGCGSIMSVNTIVAAHTAIGEHVIINRAATVGHHTVIGNYVTVSPSATIAGMCIVEDEAYVAMSATIIDRIRIGRQSIVAAGSVVTKDVPPNVMVAGVPARIMKSNVNGR